MFQLAASAEAPSVRQQQLPALGGYEALDDSRAQSLSHPSLQAFPAEAAVIMEHRQATSTVFSKFLIHRTHEHNNYCLTPLKFGVVCYIATVSECTSMKCDHCCSKNGFTGELASCRISSAGSYIRNSQGMSLPLGLVKSSRSHVSPVLSKSLY